MVEFLTLPSQEANQGWRARLQQGELSQLPRWHENPSFRRLLSLMHGCVSQQVSRSGAHCHVLGDSGAHCLAGPRKVPEQGELSGGGFCTIYCPRESHKHFFLQVQVTSRKFRWLILYPTHPQGSPHPVRAPGPHFISHLQLNTCLESSRCRGTTFVAARAGFVLGAASYGGCCHGKSQCLMKL